MNNILVLSNLIGLIIVLVVGVIDYGEAKG